MEGEDQVRAAAAREAMGTKFEGAVDPNNIEQVARNAAAVDEMDKEGDLFQKLGIEDPDKLQDAA